MVTVLNEVINEIPSLVVVNATDVHKPLPILIYFHGFSSAKEHNLPFAYLLAERGYRVILPDSKWHGEREQGINSNARQLSFWDIIMKNIEELNDIIQYFDKKQLILNSRIGVAGTSMGGITTSAALTQYPWVKVAAVLMGTPSIKTYASMLIDDLKRKGHLPFSQKEINFILSQMKEYDLSNQLDKLQNRPLLFWHGEKDPIIPIEHAALFYEQALQTYDDPEDIRLIKEANANHKVSRYAIMETVKWFERHL